MKRLLGAAGLVALTAILLSCAGFPEPQRPEHSLVIGSLVLDFPDGFYDTPATKFDMNVRLTFRNITRDTKFDLYTTRGYFYFQTNGTDEYMLQDFGLQNITIGTTTYSFGGIRLDMTIAPPSGKVVYLGHIVFTYTAPAATQRSGKTSYYSYETNVSVNWDRNLLTQYIKGKQADSPWLGLEIVDYGKK